MHDLFKSIVEDFTSLPAKVAAATKVSEASVSNEQDAARYRRLRILGCVPFAEEGFYRFQNLDSFIDADLRAHKSRGECEPTTNELPDYRQALTDLVAFVERIRDNSDGRWPAPDMNCAACTQGVSSTGEVCALHRAKQLLAVKS
jgi:hypothetical protein